MRAVLIAACLLLAEPAHAAGGGEPAPKAAPAPYVDVYPFAAPVVHEGRLLNYVFVQLRLQGGRTADGPTIKALEPRLRDAIVREAHRAPFTAKGDANAIDVARLSGFALAQGRRLGGADAFVSAEVRKQTPQHSRSWPAPRRPS